MRSEAPIMLYIFLTIEVMDVVEAVIINSCWLE